MFKLPVSFSLPLIIFGLFALSLIFPNISISGNVNDGPPPSSGSRSGVAFGGNTGNPGTGHKSATVSKKKKGPSPQKRGSGKGISEGSKKALRSMQKGMDAAKKGDGSIGKKMSDAGGGSL